MFNLIDALLKQQNILHHSNHAITICSVDEKQGLDLSKALLNTIVDKKTAIYLSGGSTPRELYEKLAKDEDLFPGAVGMVDERYGEKLHERSNEKMIKDTGLLRYFQMRDIPFYPILQNSPSLRGAERHGNLVDEIAALPLGARDDDFRKLAAQAYDEKVRSLHATFQKSVAILGIGSDGHTAGIPSQNSKLKIQNLKVDGYELVTEYNDTTGIYGERVTMTFLGLSMLDLLIVLALGDAKLHALEAMFEEGSQEEIPARFYKRPEIAVKTIIITDQMA